jgi:regulatory protein
MDPEKAYSKAAALCARNEQCSSMIREKLLRWGIESADAEKVISRLIEEKFIDDHRYAGFYARDKARFNKWGRTKIVWQLRKKSIPDEVINDAMATIPDNDYKENLASLLMQKNRQIKEDDPYKRKASLIRFAASRGFSYEEIEKALREINAE